MSKQKKADDVYKMLTRPKNMPEYSDQHRSSGTAKTLLPDLPDVLIEKIIKNYESLLKYKLRVWVPYGKLMKAPLSTNINAIDFLSLPENKELINWPILSLSNPYAVDFLSLPENRSKISYYLLATNTNPKAIKLLNEHIEEEKIRKKIRYYEIFDIDWGNLSKNPTNEAIELLMKKYKEEKQLSFQQYERYQKIDWEKLSSNTNPKAIKLLLDENINKINWFEFSRNPCNAAVKFLKDNPNYINWKALSENTNPNAISLIIKKIKTGIGLNYINWDMLSKNPAIFISYNKTINSKIKIVARILSSNVSSSTKTKITDLQPELRDKIAKELLNLYKNELREGIPIEKLNWYFLSENPNAIDLIRERIENEKNLSNYEYKRMPLSSKVSWDNLSRNTDDEAIELLEENYDKINWQILSSNPNAIHLLEERVKYQLKLEEEDNLDSLETKEKINWGSLSANPAIFVPM